MMLNLSAHHHSRAPGLLHRIPAAVKLPVGFALIVGSIIAPLEWIGWFLAMFLIVAAATWMSRIPPAFLLKRLLLLSPLVLGVAAASAFQPQGNTRWLAVCIKSALSLLIVLIISNTTPFSQILTVLRRVRVPDLLITTIALMHRYLSVLAEETERMRRARLGRTFIRRRRMEWRTLATIISQLFLRSSERAERIYQAMCARGWK
jgi:cobalt/nickel transport system permease protein